MACDEAVAARVRARLADAPDVVEKKMFGGLAFLVRGHMCIGVQAGELMVRVGPADHGPSLALPHVREMDFTGKSLKGFVYVAGPGFADDRDLAAWVERGRGFVASLPPKQTQRRPS